MGKEGIGYGRDKRKGLGSVHGIGSSTFGEMGNKFFFFLSGSGVDLLTVRFIVRGEYMNVFFLPWGSSFPARCFLFDFFSDLGRSLSLLISIPPQPKRINQRRERRAQPKLYSLILFTTSFHAYFYPNPRSSRDIEESVPNRAR